MAVAEQIKAARQELGITEYRIPASKSKQKNLLAHLQLKLDRKKKSTPSVKEEKVPKRDRSNSFAEEPRSRREFVKMVQSYRDSLRLELKAAVNAASQDMNCREPSIQTYYAWEAAEKRADEEGTKVLTDKEAEAVMNKKEELPKLAVADRKTFVEMVWEFASSNNKNIEDAIVATASRLGVKAPGHSTVYKWKKEYNVEVSSNYGKNHDRIADLLNAPISEDVDESEKKEPVAESNLDTPPTPPIESKLYPTVKQDLFATCVAFIKNANKDEIKTLTNELDTRKLQLVNQIEEQIKALTKERECLIG